MQLTKSVSSDETLTNGRAASEVAGAAAEDDEDNVWAGILDQVKAAGSGKKVVPGKNVLVLGQAEVGKTTLLAKMQGNEEPPGKGQGLEYHTLDVVDDDRDEHAKLGVYLLDGDPVHAHLMKFVLDGGHGAGTTSCPDDSALDRTLVVLTASMAAPWSILRDLETWSTMLFDHLDRMSVSAEAMRERRDRLTRLFQEYVEPAETATTTEAVTTPTAAMTRSQIAAAADADDAAAAEKVMLPLDESALTRNLGVPLVVVITKTDCMGALEKEHDFTEEHFEYIQRAVRRFCLERGAALCYCSVKAEKNCGLLYRYLVHRLYGLPFRVGARVVDKDAVFVPAGWDSEKKIAILTESLTALRPEDPYAAAIPCPPAVLRSLAPAPAKRAPDVTAMDDQAFLCKLEALLAEPLPPSAQAVSSMVVGGAKASPETRRVAAASVAAAAGRPDGGAAGGVAPGGSPSKKGVSPKPGTISGEALCTFFKSLMKDPSRGGGGGGAAAASGDSPRGAGMPSSASREALRKDAEDLLERMTPTGKKSVKGATTNSTDS